MGKTASVREIYSDVEEYYTEKVKTFGCVPRGVDWKDEASQLLRFRQLLKIVQGPERSSINDLGCGYGRLYEYMQKSGYKNMDYRGYDLSKEMISAAREATGRADLFAVVSSTERMRKADYVVASGIFNVKLAVPVKVWAGYVLDQIRIMFMKSRKGIAFNILTAYSDPLYMKPYLYYPAPAFIFDYCKRHLSRNVALLHDYDLYEFTVLVRA